MRPILAAALLSLSPVAVAADPVVVELFTSQGCSSCPPADALMADLAASDGIIALSYHVDYWDWIGWEDTYGDPAHSERQRAYARAAGSTTVYTPQFIVDGTDPIAGPDGGGLSAKLVEHAAAPELLSARGDRLTMAEGQGGRLILLHVQPEGEVEILHGENAGHTMTYHNVVRGMADLGVWDGAAGSLDLPPARDGLSRVVLAQAMTDGAPGAILGAVAVD